jgi:8-oxo-dGTP pyrophosphatase MutT (NUDIX family)
MNDETRELVVRCAPWASCVLDACRVTGHSFAADRFSVSESRMPRASMPNPRIVTAETVTLHVDLQAAAASTAVPVHNIAHAQRCPARYSDFDRAPFADRYPLLAASTLVLDRRQRLLLTRRPAFMRTFPLHYVVPGGGCDAGETLWDTARRETMEEVGIDLPAAAPPCDVVAAPAGSTDVVVPEQQYVFGRTVAHNARWRVSWFGMWESTYPVQPSTAPPQRHHLIAFFLAEEICSGAEEEGTADLTVTLSEECDDFIWVPLLPETRVGDARPLGADGNPVLMAEGTAYMLSALAAHVSDRFA